MNAKYPLSPWERFVAGVGLVASGLGFVALALGFGLLLVLGIVGVVVTR